MADRRTSEVPTHCEIPAVINHPAQAQERVQYLINALIVDAIKLTI